MFPHQPRRLFIGLLPAREAQAAISRHSTQWDWPPQARRTRFGRYHLTLQFLGDVPLAHENRLRDALRKVSMPPLALDFATPMVWKQGVAVLLPDAHEGLFALREDIVACLPQAGLHAARLQFTPHLTLAWDARHAIPPLRAPAIACTLDAFVLVWSRLDTRPAEYVVLERFAAHQAPSPGRRTPQGELFDLQPGRTVQP